MSRTVYADTLLFSREYYLEENLDEIPPLSHSSLASFLTPLNRPSARVLKNERWLLCHATSSAYQFQH